MKRRNGFTLIELLIVVLVISVLSGVTLGVLNSKEIKAKARDSQREADLRKIQAALELYFADNRQYPISSSSAWEQVNAGDAMTAAIKGSYLNTMPTDPSDDGTTNSTPCDSPENPRYNYMSDGTYYYLTSITETATTNEGFECSALNSWSSKSGCLGGVTSDVCYGVQNP